MIPNATTIGHGVGAGTSILSGASARVFTDSKPFPPSSASDNVDDGEDHHPHRIHEMPVHRQDLDAFGVLLLYIPKEREQPTPWQSKKADRHVKRMQADQRVIGCPEQVGLDGQAFVVDQVTPFASRARREKRLPGRWSEATRARRTAISPALRDFTAK